MMRRWTTWVGAWAALVLCACGGPSPAEAPSPNATEFELEVAGSIERGEETLPFVATREWESGDGISITVRASRSVFVSVAYCDSTARMSVYPENGALTVPQEQDMRIPSTGVFRVDENRGVEALYIIGSASPLESGDPNLDAQLRQANASEIGAPCAAALDLSTEESLASSATTPTEPAGKSPPASSGPPVAAPRPESRASSAAPAAAAKSSARRPANTLTDLASEYLPRGLRVEESAPTNSFASRSDRFGVAILAFRRTHSR
jgi:hypothetical protein